MRDVQSSECEPHGSIVLVDISSSRFLVIQREETKKCVFSADKRMLTEWTDFFRSMQFLHLNVHASMFHVNYLKALPHVQKKYLNR